MDDERLHVSRAVLEWVRWLRPETDAEWLALWPCWDDWLAGNADPTIAELQRLARMTNTPLGWLVLDHPPRMALLTAVHEEQLVPVQVRWWEDVEG